MANEFFLQKLITKKKSGPMTTINEEYIPFFNITAAHEEIHISEMKSE